MTNEIEIDWDMVSNELKYGNFGTEIAAQIGIHPDTLYRRVQEKYKMPFADFSAQKKSIGLSEIKKTQHKLAVDDRNPTMLIYLGKVRCGQREEEKIQVAPNDTQNTRDADFARLQYKLSKYQEKYGDEPEADSELCTSDPQV